LFALPRASRFRRGEHPRQHSLPQCLRALEVGIGSRGVGLENALDDEAVEVLMRIEQRAKAVDEGHRADPGIGARRRAGAAQGLFHDAQKNAQRQRLDRPIMFEVITQPPGNRQHSLTNRQSWKNVVGQVGGSFDHSPGVASGTDTTALARMHA